MTRPHYAFRQKRNHIFAASFDFFGRLLVGRHSELGAEPKTILIVRLDHIGDVLNATGIPQSLKGHYPRAKIIFLTSAAGAALIQNNPYIDEVIVYEAKWFRRGSAGKERSLEKLASELRLKKIDLALGLRGDLRENYLVWRAGAGYSVGYGITGGGFFLSRELTYRWDAHEIQHSLDILRAIGIRRDHLLPSLYLSDEEILRSQKLRSEWGGRTVGIQLDAGSSRKFWPELARKQFLEQALRDFPSLKFVFLGQDARTKEWLGDRIKNAPKALNLMGDGADIRELLVRVRACDYFIGSDSGPSHIAAAFGLTALVLYNDNNDFERWKPLAENAEALRKPQDAVQILRWLRERTRV